ncbi:DUF4231 domain-containing protein [Sphingopyxis sp. 2PD]|uniref:DUF4231 domain-containing protein n=1 Tax=Sphingopyxis sp. 2PD TaxID=2502196 RepID=UPI001BB2B418|nr:DUF4231 domain-containing protein [Sphingopyxis sp. 2PD]
MTAPQFDYPALYDDADHQAASSQSHTLNLIRIEYALLIVAAVLSMNWSNDPIFFAVYAAVLLTSLGVLVKRNSEKPEQGWYRGRALAESIKTSAWRFCMRAEPFDDAETVATPRRAFRDHLADILKANFSTNSPAPSNSAAGAQIPLSMLQVRSLPLDERKSYYRQHRIVNQRNWYQGKAAANRRDGTRWGRIGIAAYSLAIVMTLARIAYPNGDLWPIEPVLVFAAAIIGWTQVKKFNEFFFFDRRGS